MDIEAVPGVLSVRSSEPYIPHFSFGGSCGELAEGNCKIRFGFTVSNEPNEELEGATYHYFRGFRGMEIVRYSRPLGFSISANALLKGDPRRNDFELVVNSSYVRLIKAKLNKVFPPGAHLTALATCRLLSEGITPVHASAVAGGNDKGVLFIAPPNTGKTLTAVELVLKHGFFFLSEDMVLFDGNELIGVPATATIRYYPELVRSKSLRVKNKIADIFPPFAPLVDDAVPAYKLLKEHIKKRVRPDTIVFLETGAERVHEVSSEEASRALWNANRYELDYPNNPLIRAYEYFNETFSVEALLDVERALLRSLVERCERFLRICAPSAKRYPELLIKSL